MSIADEIEKLQSHPDPTRRQVLASERLYGENWRQIVAALRLAEAVNRAEIEHAKLWPERGDLDGLESHLSAKERAALAAYRATCKP